MATFSYTMPVKKALKNKDYTDAQTWFAGDLILYMGSRWAVPSDDVLTVAIEDEKLTVNFHNIVAYNEETPLSDYNDTGITFSLDEADEGRPPFDTSREYGWGYYDEESKYDYTWAVYTAWICLIPQSAYELVNNQIKVLDEDHKLAEVFEEIGDWSSETGYVKEVTYNGEPYYVAINFSQD